MNATSIIVNVVVGLIYMAIYSLVVLYMYDVPFDSAAFEVGLAAVALCFPRIEVDR